MDTKVIVIIAIVVLVVLWWISTNNWFERVMVKIDEAQGTIESGLKMKFDKIQNVHKAAKQVAEKEIQMYENVTMYRSGMSMGEISEVNENLNKCMAEINAVAESYPDFKASAHYMELISTVNEVEDHMDAARRIYNSNVSVFNQKLVSFPSSMVAKQKALSKKDFFKASEREREGYVID